MLSAALLVAAVLVLERYQIPSAAMEPTLQVGERVLVNTFSGDPEVGDIVVFHPPASAGVASAGSPCTVDSRPGQPCPGSDGGPAQQEFIQRVVAGPGDRLRIEGGTPVVNDVRADEDFTRPCGGFDGCNFREEITIPPDHYFMMGDNRGASQDSRFWGPVPGDWIVGKALFTYWPPDQFGSP